MKRKAERTITLRRAVASKGFLEPHFSPGARRFMLTLGTAYLTLFERVKSVCIRHEDVLVDAFERFFSGERRLIIAFRHVAKEDAPVMMYAFGKKLKNEVRQRNRNIKVSISSPTQYSSMQKTCLTGREASRSGYFRASDASRFKTEVQIATDCSSCVKR